MKTKTKTNKSFRPNISHSLFLNGFYEQEFERQKNNLVPYDESLYNNEKQLSREQINQMIAEFGHSSKVIDTNVTTIKYKNAIQRNGDFAPIRIYFKVDI
jgi:hypothetical protein